MATTDSCPDPASPTETFILDLEVQRTQALVHQDLATIDRLHADDYQLVTPAGKTFDKARYRAAVAEAPFYTGWAIADPQVRCSGGLAVLRYRARLGFPSGSVIEVWHTDVWELRAAGWQAVWSQATKCPPDAVAVASESRAP